MAQKPLYKNKKTPQSKVAANRHGKVAKTKKGAYHLLLHVVCSVCDWPGSKKRQSSGSLKAAPKKGRLLAAYAESQVSRHACTNVIPQVLYGLGSPVMSGIGAYNRHQQKK